MNYMKLKDLGFDKEQILIIERANLLGQGLSTFRNELLSSTSIKAVSASFQLPGRQIGGGTFEAIGIANTERFLHASMRVDYGFYETYGIELLDGRLFSSDHSDDDSLTVVINEATVRMVGWTEPIGKKIQPVFGPPLEVIGVVSDFHFASLHEEISPLVMQGFDMNLQQGFIPNIVSVKISGSDNIETALSHLNSSWDSQVTDRPLDYIFLEQEFNTQYKQEEQFGQVFTLFSLLVVFIAIIGVIGLSTFIAAQRNKEIGIRKVLGASVSNIWLLLSREFVILVILANLLMYPLVYLAINNWLEGYAYQVGLTIWPYLVVGSGSVAIVLITIGRQAYKAAIADPVNSIRNE
jgi:putative ABC transport system permease protein